VCWWLEDIGLGQYGVFAQHWVTGGDTLLSATQQDLEKVPPPVLKGSPTQPHVLQFCLSAWRLALPVSALVSFAFNTVTLTTSDQTY